MINRVFYLGPEGSPTRDSIVRILRGGLSSRGSVERYNFDLLNRLGDPGVRPLGNWKDRLSRLLQPGHWTWGKEAQNLIRPFLYEYIQAIWKLGARRDALSWLSAVRLGTPAITYFLAGSGLERNAHSVLRILYISAIEAGEKNAADLPPVAWLPDSSLGNWESITQGDLSDTAQLVHYCLQLYRIESLYRTVSRGQRIRSQRSGRLELNTLSDKRKLLREYDDRVGHHLTHSGLLSSAGLPDLNYVEGNWESVYASVGPTSSCPTDYRQKSLEFATRVAGLKEEDINFVPRFTTASDLSNALSFLPVSIQRKTGLTPTELSACILACSDLFIGPQGDSRLFAQALSFGLIVLPIDEFRSRMTAAIQARLNRNQDDASALLGQYLTSYCTLNPARNDHPSDSALHRYMTAFLGHPLVRNGTGVVVDLLQTDRDVAGWLLRIDLDGSGDKRNRGKLFENEWARPIVERWKNTLPAEREVRFDFSVKILELGTDRELTDIDILIRAGKWLYCADAYSKPITDAALRGESREVHRRYLDYRAKLVRWDDKIGPLLKNRSSWEVDPRNHVLASFIDGAEFAVPLVVSHRPEWIGEDSPDLFLYSPESDDESSVPHRVPRICTLMELLEVVGRGGPTPALGAAWVVDLRSESNSRG